MQMVSGNFETIGDLIKKIDINGHESKSGGTALLRAVDDGKVLMLNFKIICNVFH